MVDVPPVYSMIVELSSLIVATNDSTAPESMPGSMRIAVVLKNVFIGGSDEITVGLPGNGKYVIKDGVGSDWFDTTDTFGENGDYETMTFGENEDEFIYLEARYEYTIMINVDDAIGEDIGTSDLSWESFAK